MNLKRLATIGVSAVFCFAAIAKQQVAQKDWTILVFLNGDNSLDSFAPLNLNQMEKVGSTNNVNVVVEWGSLSAKKTVRMLMKKDSNINAVTSPVLQDMGVVDMGNYEELVNFVKWGVQQYPAAHYFVDIWDHGNGFEKSAHMPAIFKDLSYDDGSGNRITTEQLGTAMSEIKTAIGRNVDILGFDACLMGMAEVGAEVSDSVNYMVGSEEIEPGNGWPYDDFLTAINTGTGSKDAPTVANALVKAYANSYNNGDEGTETVNLATQNMVALRNMYPALSNLATALDQLASSNPSGLNSVIGNTLAFYINDYKDLGSFLTQLKSKNVGINEGTIDDVMNQMKNVVVYTQGTSTLTAAQGISIWAPTSVSDSWTQNGTRYQGFEFDQNTHWSKWIQTLAGAPSSGGKTSDEE